MLLLFSLYRELAYLRESVLLNLNHNFCLKNIFMKKLLNLMKRVSSHCRGEGWSIAIAGIGIPLVEENLPYKTIPSIKDYNYDCTFYKWPHIF